MGRITLTLMIRVTVPPLVRVTVPLQFPVPWWSLQVSKFTKSQRFECVRPLAIQQLQGLHHPCQYKLAITCSSPVAAAAAAAAMRQNLEQTLLLLLLLLLPCAKTWNKP